MSLFLAEGAAIKSRKHAGRQTFYRFARYKKKPGSLNLPGFRFKLTFQGINPLRLRNGSRS